MQYHNNDGTREDAGSCGWTWKILDIYSRYPGTKMEKSR